MRKNLKYTTFLLSFLSLPLYGADNAITDSTAPAIKQMQRFPSLAIRSEVLNNLKMFDDLKSVIKKAEEGHHKELLNLAQFCEDGNYVEMNPTKAFKLYKMAADSGSIDGQVQTARCYELGRGVHKSQTDSLKYYTYAAEGGDKDSQFKLAVKYLNGDGVKRDRVQAAKYFKQSADQGHAAAKLNLAILPSSLLTK